MLVPLPPLKRTPRFVNKDLCDYGGLGALCVTAVLHIFSMADFPNRLQSLIDFSGWRQ